MLKGIHHVTAITSDAKKIYKFYTYILGMRLVKKNVNQDDLTSFHLFFADDRGRAGTDITFFDFKGISQFRDGTDTISMTTFRVKNDESIKYWIKRFNHYNVEYEEPMMLFGKQFLKFKDFDGQQYALVSDEFDQGVAAGEPWYNGPVPNEFAIIGLGPIFLRVSNFNLMDVVLNKVMMMENVSTELNFHLYEMGDGGNGASVIVEDEPNLPTAFQGFGGVHHVAFRSEELEDWAERLDLMNIMHSGLIDRFYFKSLYFRVYPNILFELATDGPGFIDDQETYETLGETLTLPPHLRHKREYIEKVLDDFDTKRSHLNLEKEYFDGEKGT